MCFRQHQKNSPVCVISWRRTSLGFLNFLSQNEHLCFKSPTKISLNNAIRNIFVTVKPVCHFSWVLREAGELYVFPQNLHSFSEPLDVFCFVSSDGSG